MAGERLAKQIIFVTQAGLTDGAWVEVWLNGAYRRFTGRLGSGSTVPPATPNTFTIMTAANANAADVQRLTVENFLFAVQQWLVANSLASAYTLERVMGIGLASFETAGCAIQATTYDTQYDFRVLRTPAGQSGFSSLQELTNTIRPVLVAVAVTNTGAFGTTTGAITLTASNGTVGTYTYLWADAGAPLTPGRTGLAAGTFRCTVTDASGASTVAVAVVGSDGRLDVLVNRTDNNVELVPSGGVSPYAYAWLDGPTTATRLALATGTYTCTVSDARGASRQVVVVVDPYRFYWSKNPVTLPLDAGDDYRQDPDAKPNLSFVCEVWVEEVYLSGVFVQVGITLEQPADRTGRTVFDAQELLDSYLQEHLPALNQAVPSRADSLFRRFYFRYAEKYGTPPVAAALSNQAEHYVVFGGLDFFEAPTGTWFDYQARQRPFLTWEPNDKAVLPSQPEYLYFMVNSFAVVNFRLYARIFYADNTEGLLLVATVPSVRRFEVYCLPAGYQQLRLGAVAGGPAVVGWELWVIDNTGVVQSERRRYVLNTDYVAQPRYFLYTTSLGGVATLACTGYAKATLGVKAEESDRAQGAGYDPLLGDTLVSDKAGVRTLSVTSGPLSPAYREALQDLWLARRVTLQANDTYFAGRVKAKDQLVADEAPGESSAVEFDFLLPKQRLYNPRLAVQAVSADQATAEGGLAS